MSADVQTGVDARTAADVQTGVDARTAADARLAPRGSEPRSVAPRGAEPLVDVRDLDISFGGAAAAGRTGGVRGISFSIEPGRCHALVGESGSGKSISARALVGLNGDTADTRAASLRFDGRELLTNRGADWRALRGRGIGLVLQDALQSLDPLQTIGHEVAEALGARLPGSYRRDAALRIRVVDLLESVGIPHAEERLDQYSHELSGGLRQRALIATAIAREPRLIIADEPTTALDTTVQREILGLLQSRLAGGTALLLISHDLSLVAEIADTVSVLRAGAVVEEGATAEVLRDPQTAYTRALLAAVPTQASKGFRLAAAGAAGAAGAGAVGDAPDAADDPSPTHIPLPPRPSRASRASRAEQPLLSARGLVKRFAVPGGGHRFALQDVELDLHAGQTVGVVGESGSGKTTLTRAILGLTTLDAGEVRLGGGVWNPLPERLRRPRRSALQLVSQDPLGSFDPRFTIGRLLTDGARAGGVERARRTHRAIELLEAVGLDETFLRRNPRQISGGQRQRIAIARALAAGPEILVCDEPVSALDVSVQAQVLDLIADLQHSTGTAVLFVSHDLGVVHHVSDDVVVMRHGRVVESGDVREVYRAPQHEYTRALLDAVPKLASASASVSVSAADADAGQG